MKDKTKNEKPTTQIRKGGEMKECLKQVKIRKKNLSLSAKLCTGKGNH